MKSTCKKPQTCRAVNILSKVPQTQFHRKFHARAGFPIGYHLIMYPTDDSGERVYKFQPYEHESFYYTGGGKGYGTLKTSHFCFMCLECPSNATKLKANARRMGYCLAIVKGPSRLNIYAIFYTNTCKKVSAHVQ